jgi:hypothetical protein
MTAASRTTVLAQPTPSAGRLIAGAQSAREASGRDEWAELLIEFRLLH